MLRFLKRTQPKQLIAVYVEPGQIEVVRGRKKWRSWEMDPPESQPVSVGESVFDCLQRLNLRPRRGQAAAFLCVAARSFYSFHREYYPLALKDQLQDVLEFDWDENLFYEGDRTLHFAAPPSTGDERLVVPVFSMRSETYEKFYQATGGSSFQYFTVVPSALTHGWPVQAAGDEQEAQPELIGRCLDDRSIELNQFSDGVLVDSLLLNRGRKATRLFLDGMDLFSSPENGKGRSIVLLCKPGDSPGALGEEAKESSGFVNLDVGESFLGPWLAALLGRDRVAGFGDPLVLKPREIPKVVLPILALMVVYALFASFQLRAHHNLAVDFQSLQVQRKQLEAKWHPIEERRTRMAQLQQDKKSLSQFDSRGYPILELLTLLTEITPQDTWLEFFSVNDKEIRIRGQSKAAVKYVSELSKVEGFGKVSLVSPIRRDPRSDSERFYLRIEINSKKLKQTLKGIELMGEEEPPPSTEPQGPVEPDESDKAAMPQETNGDGEAAAPGSAG